MIGFWPSLRSLPAASPALFLASPSSCPGLVHMLAIGQQRSESEMISSALQRRSVLTSLQVDRFPQRGTSNIWEASVAAKLDNSHHVEVRVVAEQRPICERSFINNPKSPRGVSAA
ncbi:hypothetical protein BKA80DRAFT_257435 [Phyllosticta citrichinensis]